MASAPPTAPNPVRGVASFARAASMAVAGVLVLYIVIIARQGGAHVGRVAVVAVFLAGCGMLAWLGSMGSIEPTRRTVSLIAASSGLWSAALISLFSIGLLLLVAAVLATVACVRLSRIGARPSVLGLVAALTLPPLALIGGIALS